MNKIVLLMELGNQVIQRQERRSSLSQNVEKILSLGKKWKDYKCSLKGDYVPKYKTKNALLKTRPSRIPRDQWSGLVFYWLSEKAKRRIQTNRNNRAMQKMPHTGGSKSILP